MPVRIKLIVLAVLSDDYFKLNFHRPKYNMGGKKEKEKLEGGNTPTTSSSKKTPVNFQKH